MATKAKAKAKAAPKPKPRKTSRKATAKKTESQFPQALVAAGRFAPGTKVGFWAAAEVGTERAAAREPFPKPAKTVTVGKDGSISLSGLDQGEYVAAAKTGDDGSWTYVAFSVKADG